MQEASSGKVTGCKCPKELEDGIFTISVHLVIQLPVMDQYQPFSTISESHQTEQQQCGL